LIKHQKNSNNSKGERIKLQIGMKLIKREITENTTEWPLYAPMLVFNMKDIISDFNFLDIGQMIFKFLLHFFMV
jgi:hypothetical protein